MQNKNKQSNKASRHFHEQVGIIALLTAVLASVVSLSHDPRRAFREIALKPAMAIVSNSGRENETARMPVSYEGIYRWQATSGQ